MGFFFLTSPSFSSSFLLRSAGYCQNLDELIPTSNHDSPTVVPKFVSRGHLYKAIVGDTIELPCKVQNLGMKIVFEHILCTFTCNGAIRNDDSSFRGDERKWENKRFLFFVLRNR